MKLVMLGVLVMAATAMSKNLDCGAYPKAIVESVTCPSGTSVNVQCREDGNWVVSCQPGRKKQ